MTTYTAIEVRRWLRRVGVDDTVALPTKRRDLIIDIPAPIFSAWRVSNITGGPAYRAQFTIVTL